MMISRLFYTAAFFISKTILSAEDLKPDPATVFGKLDNGFNYIIRPNAEPPGRFSVRLHIDAGSLMEADDQRGVAHFLEHMVFNGTRNFTAAELVPKMQRLGIAFGAHANAYTSFDETVYMLDLPNMEDETLDLTFTVMRDFADGALLKADEIDKERGVILSEKNQRDSVGYRMMIKQFEYLLPGSRLMQRVPIGTEEVIKNAPRERFVDFYRQFYTPERMTFVVVGDFELEKMEKRVRETFISLTNPKDPGQDPPKDTPPSDFGFRAEVFTDKEITADDLTLYSIRPFTRQPDSKAERLKYFPLNAAHAIFSRRFDILSKKEGSPIRGGGASRTVYFDMAETAGLNVSPAENKWEEALPVMEQELRRALQFGFTEAEIEEIQARWINAAEEAVKRAKTRGSQSICMQYVGAIKSGKTVITPEANLALVKEGASLLNPEKIHQAFRSFWDTQDLSLVLTTNKSTTEDQEKLIRIWRASSKIKVSPPEKQKDLTWDYTHFGETGKVVARTEVEDLGITQLTLDNGIHVNLKSTDFKKNSIGLLARFGSGTFTMSQDQPGLNQFASTIFNSGGLGKFSEDELGRLLAGKNVGAGLGITDDAFTLNGRTTPEDLELQLQLMCAQLTDPGFRPEAERQFKMQIPMIFNQMKHTPMGSMMKIQEELAGNDFRSKFPSEKQLTSYTTAMVKDWLSPQLLDTPMELSIVGDFQFDALLPLLLKTFGALPDRKTQRPDYSALRQVTLPKRPATRTLNFESKIPTANTMVAWSIPTAFKNEKTARRFNILAAILSDRLREEIREKKGGSYSPRAQAAPHPVLNFGYLQASATVKPEDVEEYGTLLVEIADKLARDGATQDELERAFKPIKSNLEKSKRENTYWLNTVLSRSQQYPYILELARNRDADYTAITLDEINQLASKHLPKNQSLLYRVIPTGEE